MTTNLKQQESDQINYDTSLLGDMFRFYYDKGIELEQVDYENAIVEKERFIAGKKKYLDMLSISMNRQMAKTSTINPKTSDKYYEALEQLEQAQSYLSSLIEACDANIEKREHGTEEFVLESDGYSSLGQSIIEFLELYVGTLTLDELSTIFHAVELMHENKEISWYHYLVASISTSRRLARATKKEAGWWDTCQSLRRNKAKFQRSNLEVAMDTEARVFGEMNIDMESAIDRMRFIRKAAELNHCSLIEAACLYEK